MGSSVKTVFDSLLNERKEFAPLPPLGSKFIPFTVDSFSEGAYCAGKQTGSYNSYQYLTFIIMAENTPCVSVGRKII